MNHTAREFARIIGMHRMLTDAVGDMATPVEQPAYNRWTVWSESWLPFLAFEGDSSARPTSGR